MDGAGSGGRKRQTVSSDSLSHRDSFGKKMISIIGSKALKLTGYMVRMNIKEPF